MQKILIALIVTWFAFAGLRLVLRVERHGATRAEQIEQILNGR